MALGLSSTWLCRFVTIEIKDHMRIAVEYCVLVYSLRRTGQFNCIVKHVALVNNCTADFSFPS